MLLLLAVLIVLLSCSETLALTHVFRRAKIQTGPIAHSYQHRLNLYLDPNESSASPPPTASTGTINPPEALSKSSIACVTSSPLCRGETPTPLKSASSSLSVAAAPPSGSRRVDPRKSYLRPVNSPDEYKAEVYGAAGTDTIVVVRFHAPYCKACKMIAFAYERFAKKMADSTNPANLHRVKFVDVEILDRNDYPDLDVSATPYGMIYHPTPDGGLEMVEKAAIARRQFSKFKKVLNWYRKGMCEMPEEFFTNPHYVFEDENLIL